MATKLDIAIIDYQMGNLRSVQKAFEFVGAQATITNDPEQIVGASKVVLPGVGAFPDAMRELRSRNLIEPIIDVVQRGKPFLGICLGLQLLFETGTEGGEHKGIGILPGRVVRFELPAELKVPHMGWNQFRERKSGCALLAGISPTAYFYFVHSYYVMPVNQNDSWLDCEYGTNFCAAVWRDNLFATQFHPEKSQANGIQMLKNFSSL